MYKLVAIDLDGTLLNSEKKISHGNIRAVQRAMEKDVKVVICSGRIFNGAMIYARQIFSQDPVVACNGAMIKDLKTGEFWYNNSLNLNDCFKIIDICHKENIYFHAYSGNTMYSERMEGSAAFYSKLNNELPPEDRIDVRVVDDVSAALKDSSKAVAKIVVISQELELLMKARKQVTELGSVEVVSSFYDNFEVVNGGVSKGNAIRFLSDKLDIKREEIIAIGDNENDYSMIQFAGLGVAMGNAEIPVKELADYITLDNDEDGVAAVINKFIV